MDENRHELHLLLDRVPDADLPVMRKLLRALAVECDVAPAEDEGELTGQALLELEAAESFFDRGGEGVPHARVLKEFGMD